jgi:hypothetical protein
VLEHMTCMKKNGGIDTKVDEEEERDEACKAAR